MKHVKPVTREPQAAQTSSLQVKVQFLVNLVDRIVTYVLQKGGGAL